MVADTKKWEQSAAYYIDTHGKVEAWVKNEGLGFGIPYFHNGQDHEFRPDFIVKLKGGENRTLIIETKGFDDLLEIKQSAAPRWVNAVNADGSYGRWEFHMARKPSEVRAVLDAA